MHSRRAGRAAFPAAQSPGRQEPPDPGAIPRAGAPRCRTARRPRTLCLPRPRPSLFSPRPAPRPPKPPSSPSPPHPSTSLPPPFRFFFFCSFFSFFSPFFLFFFFFFFFFF